MINMNVIFDEKYILLNVYSFEIINFRNHPRKYPQAIPYISQTYLPYCHLSRHPIPAHPHFMCYIHLKHLLLHLAHLPLLQLCHTCIYCSSPKLYFSSREGILHYSENYCTWSCCILGIGLSLQPHHCFFLSGFLLLFMLGLICSETQGLSFKFHWPSMFWIISADGREQPQPSIISPTYTLYFSQIYPSIY